MGVRLRLPWPQEETEISWFGRQTRVRWEASVGTCGFLRKEGSALCPLPLAGVWDLRAEGGLGPLIESRVERVTWCMWGERTLQSSPKPSTVREQQNDLSTQEQCRRKPSF